MERIRIVLLALFAAICYGIVHDQVTARVCLEYFTIGHPPLFSTTSPTLLALGWGVVATWCFGLPLGLLLAVAARGGQRPPLSAADLRKPIAVLLAVMAASAVLAGIVGGSLAARGTVWLTSPWDQLVPRNRQVAFLADLSAADVEVIAISGRPHPRERRGYERIAPAAPAAAHWLGPPAGQKHR